MAKDSIRSLQGNCSSLQDYIVHQDAYSRRDNLLFDKVPESKENEDCAKVIRKLFVEELKMDTHRASDIKIMRCHKLGKPKKESVRTIICHFLYFGDREKVRKRGFELKNSNIRMSEDFPKNIVAQRNVLAPIMFEARKQKLKAFLVAEKLIIEDKSYTIHTLNTLPTTLDLTKVGIVKVTDDITAFYGSLSCLSNFKFSPFTNNRGICFHSSVQFIQHSKAILFDDASSADKILAAKTPGECTFLGNRVQNFNFDRWKLHAKDNMKQGLCLKFSQNKNF